MTLPLSAACSELLVARSDRDVLKGRAKIKSWGFSAGLHEVVTQLF